MRLTARARRVLEGHAGETPAVRARLAQLLSHGRLGGTGRLLVLPVDQGFEHGPARSFGPNPDAFDPLWHWRLAIDGRVSALAGPLGLIEAGAGAHAGEVPTILKLNGANSLAAPTPARDQAFTASPRDALRLGCAAVGMTIYPGSDAFDSMLEEAREAIAEARALGLASVVWSYPRGGRLAPEDETALDVVCHGAHMAALVGAHVIKVKAPSARMADKAAEKAEGPAPEALAERAARVRRAAFAGRRIVLFSGGAARGREEVLAEARALAAGGGSGSIVGRNVFQRPRGEALALLADLAAVWAEAARAAPGGASP